jgi:hypothetical protein
MREGFNETDVARARAGPLGPCRLTTDDRPREPTRWIHAFASAQGAWALDYCERTLERRNKEPPIAYTNQVHAAWNGGLRCLAYQSRLRK